MRTFLIITLFAALIANCLVQKSYSKDLPDFEKIMISSHISATLIKSDKNKIEINQSNVEIEKINIRVKGNTLKVYLDKSRIWPKTQKVYKDSKKRRVAINTNAKVSVTVFYKNIKSLEFRGENQVLVSKSNLNVDKFKITSFGETQITLDSLCANSLKIRCFGENHLAIYNSNFNDLIIRSMGENSICTSNSKSQNIKSTSVGENNLEYNCDNKLKVISIGESDITWVGNGYLHKRFVIGENSFYKK